MIGREYAKRKCAVRPRIVPEYFRNMKLSRFMKVFLCWTLSLLMTVLYMSVRSLRKNELLRPFDKKKNEIFLKSILNRRNENKDFKYILQWTQPENVPFVYMGKGPEGFISRNCKFTNCFVTPDRYFLGDYTNFDVIAFHGPEVMGMQQKDLPEKRSPHQKFVFASIESADNYPLCYNRNLDGFFNWTWTYRLDSESKWGYIVVRDSNGTIIGPKKEMHWMKLEDMDPVTEDLKKSLQSKTKAAAWFVSNCRTKRHREDFVPFLEKELEKYQLKVDIYGKCGDMSCSRDDEDKCFKLIEKDYYFYLSFENSFSEDYVTEKLLNALTNNAIPIVYGGANYTRFMPDGIYLNAREMNATELAKRMHELIQDKEKYAEFFKWKKYYTYHRRADSTETDDYCGMCALLNDEEQMRKVTIYKHFKEWWTPPDTC